MNLSLKQIYGSTLRGALKGLKKFLIPFGAIMLGLLIAISIFVPTFIASFTYLGKKVLELVGENNFNNQVAYDSLVTAFAKLDINQLDSIFTIFDNGWLRENLYAAIKAGLNGSTVYETQILGFIDETIEVIQIMRVISTIFIVAGPILGYILLRNQMRGTEKIKNFKRFVFFMVLDSILNAGILVLVIYLSHLWTNSLILSTIVLFFIYTSLSFLEAYIVHIAEGIDVLKLFDWKKILVLIAGNLTVYVLLTMLSLIIIVLNTILGLIFLIVFLIMALVIISYNNENYISSFIIDDDNKPEVEFVDHSKDEDEPMEEEIPGEDEIPGEEKPIEEEMK